MPPNGRMISKINALSLAKLATASQGIAQEQEAFAKRIGQ